MLKKLLCAITRLVGSCSAVVCMCVIVQGDQTPSGSDSFPVPSREQAFATIGGSDYVPMYLRRISPSAIASAGRVFCAFQNSQGQPVVMAYDVDGRSWSSPITASTKSKRKDMHGSPAIYLDPRGYFHLFFGCHNSPMHHVRSQQPGDISAWTDLSPASTNASYPEAIRLADGRLRLFYRAGGHPEPWVMQSSPDHGESWHAPERLIEMRLDPVQPRAAAYARFFAGRDGTTIHCFFNYKEDDAAFYPRPYRDVTRAAYRYNLYYMRRAQNGTWRTAGGEPLDLPITKKVADAKCLIYDSGEIFAFPGAYAADDDDNPYLVFRTGVHTWDKGGPDRVFRASVAELNDTPQTRVALSEKFVTFRGGHWHITSELPSNWPRDVTRILRGPGEAAYSQTTAGGLGINYNEPWFMFYQQPPEPTSIFLYSQTHGFARSVNGPASLP